MKKLMFLLAIIFSIACQVKAGPYLVPIDVKEYFDFDPDSWRKYYIYEKKDISQACFFSLEGLRMMPVNVLLREQSGLFNSVEVGVTAVPVDKETVITYYYPEDFSGNTIWPMEKKFIKSLSDRIYRYGEEAHQARYHAKRHPLRQHTHWVYDHPENVVSLYQRYAAELSDGQYGLCHEQLTLSPAIYYYWLKARESAVNRKLLSSIVPSVSIDQILHLALDIPQLVSVKKRDRLYQGVLRAAIIFNSYPEIKCLNIGNTEYTRGRQDLEIDEPEVETCIHLVKPAQK